MWPSGRNPDSGFLPLFFGTAYRVVAAFPLGSLDMRSGPLFGRPDVDQGPQKVSEHNGKRRPTDEPGTCNEQDGNSPGEAAYAVHGAAYDRVYDASGTLNIVDNCLHSSFLHSR